MWLCISWVCCFFLSGPLAAQDALDNDSALAKRYLLYNPTVKLEAIEAVNAMYNFEFGKSDRAYRIFQLKYPGHPMAYFLLGLNEWWKIMPNEDVTTYDEPFLAYMDSCIYYGEKLKEREPDNLEAVFFLAAAHGFKGRLLSNRKQWTKAAFCAKAAMGYMQISRANPVLRGEFLFGLGLYNYYSIWIPENYKALRPIMLFFPKGDKNKGIEMLKEVTRYSFYTRVEAQYFLTRIYAVEENRPAEAYELMTYLHKTFPGNPFFHRWYTRLSYSLGYWQVAETEAKVILERINQYQFGYEAVAGRYASFYLAYVHLYNKKDREMAKAYFSQCKEFSERSEAYSTGYYLYSLSYLGRMAKEDKKIDLAREYYSLLVKHETDKKSLNYKEARAYLRATEPKRKGLFGLW